MLPAEMWTGWCVAICLLELGGTNGEITQQPSLVLQGGQEAHFECNQTNDHPYMYWYRQRAGQGPEFLYHYYNNEEQQKGDVSKRFSATQSETYYLKLNILAVERNDSALYLCATSRYQNSYSELHFGKGTRLTVLEEGQEVTPPKVTIFAPSKREVEEKPAVTLVCLANDFFPDHININWYLYDKEITVGVKTEEFSTLDSKTKRYSLTSRLKISKEKWQDSLNMFQCKVRFYVNNTADVYASVINGEGCDTAKVEYQNSGYIGSLIYLLLIFKSTLYGAFVMGLMLRKKRVQ